MISIDEIIKKSKKEIRKYEFFKKNYVLNIFQLKKRDISFEPFYGKTILEWCKSCEKGLICGRCPSEYNNFNKEKKKRIQSYKKGLLLIIKVPSEELAGIKAFKENLPSKTQRLVNDSLRIIKKKLEKANYQNFYLLGAGPCKLAYCKDKDCLLLTKNKCRYPGLANDIMECSGINVFKTTENIGDKIYYIDRNTDPRSVPYGSRVGLILFK